VLRKDLSDLQQLICIKHHQDVTIYIKQTFIKGVQA